MAHWRIGMGVIVATALVGGGCEQDAEPPPPNAGTAHCSPSGQALGCADELWLCTGGEEPTQYLPDMACTGNGTVMIQDGSGSEVANAYCCTDLSDAGSSPTPACSADPTAPCAQGVQGFACVGGDTPTADDASLACSPVPAALHTSDVSYLATQYCCSGPDAGASCAVDPLVDCKSGRVGFSCSGAVGPDAVDPVLACDEQTVADGQALYCCSFQAPAGQCIQDTAVPCDGDATGYACGGTSTPPLSADASSCLAGTPVGSTIAYCCR
jgi:hypothetical protein